MVMGIIGRVAEEVRVVGFSAVLWMRNGSPGRVGGFH